MLTVPQNVRWGRLAVCLVLPLGIWISPAPEDLSPGGWQVFAIFVGVVSGFLLRPLDMAPTVLLGLLALVAARVVDTGTQKTIGLKTIILGGFGDTTVWLVVLAFLLADAVEGTGLGRRIALLLLRALGRSMTGLGYAVAATELALAPFIPSNTARGGGIIAPIVEGVAKTLGSTPHETPRHGGAYLVQVGAHSNLVTSAMFLTAMAGNANVPPAAKLELGVDLDFTTWLQGSIVPGLVSLGLVPLVLRFLEPPARVEITSVRGKVREDLAALGNWTRGEIRLAFLLGGLLILWSTQRLWSAPERTDAAATVALLGVVLLILGGIRTWKELASSWRAWDALVWLGGFVALAESLKMSGFTDWFAASMRALFAGWEPVTTAVVLALIYFASMYFFSQLTAHIAALAAVFFAVAASSGCPPLLTVALIAYFGCLCGATTPWSTGPVIIYFSQGYVSVQRWMRTGLCMAAFQITVWLAVGMPWWRALGWW